MKHRLSTITVIPGAGGVQAECECSDPGLDEGVWTGMTTFYGFTEDEVRSQFEEHLLEEGVLV